MKTEIKPEPPVASTEANQPTVCLPEANQPKTRGRKPIPNPTPQQLKAREYAKWRYHTSQITKANQIRRSRKWQLENKEYWNQYQLEWLASNPEEQQRRRQRSHDRYWAQKQNGSTCDCVEPASPSSLPTGTADQPHQQ